MVWLLADKFLDRPVYDKLRINIQKTRKERKEEIEEKTELRFNVGVKAVYSEGCEE
jgi:hypothetical protein